MRSAPWRSRWSPFMASWNSRSGSSTPRRSRFGNSSGARCLWEKQLPPPSQRKLPRAHFSVCISRSDLAWRFWQSGYSGSLPKRSSRRGSSRSFDLAFAEALHAQATVPKLECFEGIACLANPWTLLAMTLVVTTVLLRRRQFFRAAAWITALTGGGLLNTLLKSEFHRLRPNLPNPFVTEPGWSFPSGHAMMSVIAYGMLAYLLRRGPARFTDAAADYGRRDIPHHHHRLQPPLSDRPLLQRCGGGVCRRRVLAAHLHLRHGTREEPKQSRIERGPEVTRHDIGQLVVCRSAEFRDGIHGEGRGVIVGPPRRSTPLEEYRTVLSFK